MRSCTIVDNILLVGPPVARIGAVLLTQAELKDYLAYLRTNKLDNTEHYDDACLAYTTFWQKGN